MGHVNRNMQERKPGGMNFHYSSYCCATALVEQPHARAKGELNLQVNLFPVLSIDLLV